MAELSLVKRSNLARIAAMKFTLGKMFVAVAMLALACAGMMYITSAWASGIFTLTLLLFAAVLLQGALAGGRTRATALAFSIVGFIYLMLVSFPACSGAGKRLFTNYPLAWVASSKGLIRLSAVLANGTTVHPDASADMYIDTAFAGGEEATGIAEIFLIGHCVFSWLFALLAAWFTGRMYEKRKRPEATLGL